MQRIKEPLDELPICSDEELITKYLIKDLETPPPSTTTAKSTKQSQPQPQRQELTWVELGCGNAELMRKLVAAQSQQSQSHNQQDADADTATTTNAIIKKVLALEVDKQQHAKNLQLDNLPSAIEFGIGGMETIPSVSNNSVDAVIMLKSLHHVGNAELLQKGLDEVYRVLKPGGKLYVSEPVFAGPFNDIIRLFHDENQVREIAFLALQKEVVNGSSGCRFELEIEIHCQSRLCFPNGYKDFESKIMNVTHTEFHFSSETKEQVKDQFMKHVNETTGEANFLVPLRIDILVKK